MIIDNKLSKISQTETDFSFCPQRLSTKKEKTRNVTKNIKYCQSCHLARLWIASYNILLSLRHTPVFVECCKQIQF